MYTPITARQVRKILVQEKGYKRVPTRRTISTKNELGYRLKKVSKAKPLKKIPETDEIFEEMHKLNAYADQAEGVLRLSMDAKARIYIGPFSRGGKNRLPLQAVVL